MFKKRWGQVWTHVQAGRKRQIDYILVDRMRRAAIKDSGVFTGVSVGSDHRAIYADFVSDRFRRKGRWRGGHLSKKSLVGWKPEDATKYKDELETKVQDILRTEALQSRSISLDEKLSILEKTVTGTARHCQ
eukprot:2419109-Karenia_brevis.AAC.1